VRGQQRDVALALPQRRQAHRDDVEAIVEVLAKQPLLDALAQVHVGGGHHPHVHLDRAGAAEPFDLAFLQRAQELGLHGQRQVAHLVEEEGAAIGALEAPGAALQRAGVGALLGAEELGLEDALRQRRRVHRHERPAGARRQRVDGPRHQLLAGAALAEQKHGGRRRRHLSERVHHGAHLLAAAHQADERRVPLHGGDAGAQGTVLLEQGLALQGAADDRQHLAALGGLGDEVVGALAHGRDGVLHRAIGGHDDDVRLGLQRARRLEQGLAVHARHHQVGEHHMHGVLAQELERGLAVVGDQHLVAGALEDAPQAVTVGGLVIDDEDARHAHGIAKRRPR
jgi:hypothetical protein